jgi:hypothetical protein
MNLEYNKNLMMLLKSESKRGILIKGNFGVGKSAFIKDFFINKNINSNKLKYKKYSIINASTLMNLKLNKAVYYNNQILGENINNNFFQDLEKNQGMGILNKIGSFLKNLFSSKENKGLIGAGINIISSVYNDYVDNYCLDNFIIVIDEIDRKPDGIKLKDLFSKLIHIQEKYNNIKIICVSNTDEFSSDDSILFEKWKEKLFSRYLHFEKSDYLDNKLDFNFITDGTIEYLEHYEINKNNIRISEIILDVFKYVDDNKKNIQKEYINEIKNELYIAAYKYFDKDNYIKGHLKQIKSYSSNGMSSKDNLIIVSNAWERTTLEIKEFFNFNTNPIDEMLERKNISKENYKFIQDSSNYFNNIYNQIPNGKINPEEYIKKILKTNYKHLDIINDNMTEYCMLYWVNHAFDLCNRFESEFFYSEIVKNKLKEILSEIESITNFNEPNNIDAYEKQFYVLKLKMINEGNLNNKTLEILQKHDFLIDDIINNIKKNKLKTKYSHDLDYNKILLQIKENPKLFVENFIHNSDDVFLDIRKLHSKIGISVFKESILPHLKEINNENVNFEFIINNIIR